MERKSLGRTLYNAGLTALYTGGTLAVAKLISPGVSRIASSVLKHSPCRTQYRLCLSSLTGDWAMGRETTSRAGGSEEHVQPS